MPVDYSQNLFLKLSFHSSYIDLLQQMCLFNHATDLIRHCKDDKISKESRKSTTIHETCPTCWKPLLDNSNLKLLTRNTA